MKNSMKLLGLVFVFIISACQKEVLLIDEKQEEGKTNLKFDTKPNSTKTLIAKDWSKSTTLIGRSSHTSEVFKNKVWIIAGGSGGPLSRADVWWSANGKDWETSSSKPPFPNRRGHASVVFQDKLWITGGLYRGAFDVNNDVWWSSDGMEWNQVMNSNFPTVTHHTLTVFKGVLWLIGGYFLDPETDFAVISPQVWRSEDGATWSRVVENAPFQGRAQFATVVHSGKLWLIGGKYGEGPPNHASNNDVWFSKDGENWELATSKPGFSKRKGHKVVSDGKRMWLTGGSYGGGDEIWYSTNGIKWSQAKTTKEFHGRSHHTSVMFQEKLWIINGYAEYPYFQKYLTDIWSFEESGPKPIDDITSKTN